MTAELTWGRRYLMCPPTHFDVSYAINPWMDLSVEVDRERAQRQWQALVTTYRDAGAQIELLEPRAGLPDLVFTANLGIVDAKTFIPARMRHDQRRAEPQHAERWFRARGFEISSLGEDVVQEGAGDALPFGDTLVTGYGGRSSAGAYVDLQRVVPGRIAPVKLSDPRFYHLDIVFCPLGARSALIAVGALGPDDARLLTELVPDPIVLTDEEAAAFCANSVVIGHTVVMAACTPRLERELRARDLEALVIDVSEFLKAGGGPRCLTLALDVALGRQDSATVTVQPVAERMRIDRWLWAARFFKTRGLAAEAVKGGRVHVDGQRVKPSKEVGAGDRLEITIGQVGRHVVVLGTAPRRGPASEAALLYEESAASVAERERVAAERRLSAPPDFDRGGRPTKRDRRRLDADRRARRARG